MHRGETAIKTNLGECPEDILFMSQGHVHNMFSHKQQTDEEVKVWQITRNGEQTLDSSVVKVPFDTN